MMQRTRPTSTCCSHCAARLALCAWPSGFDWHFSLYYCRFFCICLFLNMLQYIYMYVMICVVKYACVLCVCKLFVFFYEKLVNHTACILIYALVDEYRGLYFPIYWYIADYNNPIGESLLTNQYDGMIDGFWTLLTCSNTAKWILLAISPLGPHSSTTNIPPFYHHFP